MLDYDKMSINEIFGIDTQERTRSFSNLILKLEKEGENGVLFDEAMREAHSLKAAARIVNNPDVQNLAHRMEETLEIIKKQKRQLAGNEVDLFLKCIDAMREVASAFVASRPCGIDTNDLIKRLEDLKSGRLDPVQKNEAAGEPFKEKPAASDPTIRIGIERLNKLMNLSGEIYTHTLQLRQQQRQFKPCLEALGKNVLGYWEAVERLSVRLEGLGADFQNDIMRSRMLPAEVVFEPQTRAVRDFAREFGKKIRLELKGTKTELDKTVLELIKDPLVHLVRNACDHGIESPEERLKSKKSEEGRIVLEAAQQGDRVLILVEDDGRGIDASLLKRKILEKQLLDPDKFNALSDEEALDFIFQLGFSTAESVTHISGRGIGLDIVRSSVVKIGGQIRVETRPGQWTRFILSLPLTLAVTRALLAEVGAQAFCFPLAQVAEVKTISSRDIQTMEGKEVIDVRGEFISLVSLAQLWNLNGDAEKTLTREHRCPVILLGQGHQKVAVSVARLLDEKAIVSKPLDPRLGPVQDIAGGTVLDDGEAALIVDPTALLRSCRDYAGQSTLSRKKEDEVAKRKMILIVEDALTVRELEKKVLENSGYEVITAVDGLDGYHKAKEHRVDLVVTDIEMPRMNGFELIGLLKKDARLGAIPTIIISFREREEDKRRGMEAGADRYITKSQFDNKILLDTIRKLIGK